MTDHAAIAAMLTAGATYRQITAQLGVGQATIAKIRNTLGIPVPPGRGGRCASRRGDAAQTDARIADMLRAGATYADIRSELHVSALRISGIRQSHNIPLPPGRTPGPTGVRTPEQTLAHYSRPTTDGHTHWTGPTDGAGKPMVWHRHKGISAWRVAFRVHHNREPNGHVRSACDDPECIAGAHLTDSRLREANRRADQAFERIFGSSAPYPAPTTQEDTR
jgi:uncharacterized protein YerC